MKGATGQRQCMSCRKYRPKSELFRIMKTGEGILIDPDRHHFGRSAYLCRNQACVACEEKRRNLSKTFGMPVTSDVVRKLKEVLHAE